MATSDPTLKYIAERLNLSITTVSRSLSGAARKYRVSRKTEAAVRKLAEELRFTPNNLARGLLSKKTLTIGLVVPEVSNPFFAEIARTIVTEARCRDYLVLLCDSQEDTAVEIAEIRALRSHRVDGLIVCPVGKSADHLKDLEEGGFPVILVDRCFPGLGMPYVATHNLFGGRQATEYLVANGHRRIGFVQGLPGTLPNNLRLAGYREILQEHRIPWDESLVVGDSFTEQSGYVATKVLLRRAKDLTAIFAASTLVALGALRALTEEGVAVPGRVSLICFGDAHYLAQIDPPLTAVAQSTLDLGQIAVKLLFGSLDSGSAPREGILLPTRLVVRQSVQTLTA